MEDKKFELIISIVNRGHSDVVVDAARNAGAGGGTIIHGRGTGVHEKDSILGVSIQPEKEVIMTLTDSENKAGIMQAICESADIDKEGVGICFTLPVNQVRGISKYRQTIAENKLNEEPAKEPTPEQTSTTPTESAEAVKTEEKAEDKKD